MTKKPPVKKTVKKSAIKKDHFKRIPVKDISISQRIRDENIDLQPHINDLVESIGNPNIGLINPITVYKDKKTKNIELIAGYCRLQAVIILNWPTIPCIFKKARSLHKQRDIEMTENAHRQDFSPTEKARYAIIAIEKEKIRQKKLRKKGITPEFEPKVVVAKIVKLSRASLTRCLAIHNSDNNEVIDIMNKESIGAAWEYAKNRGILGKRADDKKAKAKIDDKKDPFDNLVTPINEDADLDELAKKQKDTPTDTSTFNKTFNPDGIPEEHITAIEHWDFKQKIKELIRQEFENDNLQYNDEFLTTVTDTYWIA